MFLVAYVSRLLVSCWLLPLLLQGAEVSTKYVFLATNDSLLIREQLCSELIWADLSVTDSQWYKIMH